MKRKFKARDVIFHYDYLNNDLHGFGKVEPGLFCSGVILVHNHPSGEVKPSSADIKMTKEVKDCLKLFDVTLVDHIILSEKKYYSFTDERETER